MRRVSAAGLLLGSAGLAALAVTGAAAQGAAAALPEIDVIGTTPLGGDGLDRDKVPTNVTTIGSKDIAGANSPAIAQGIARKTPGVNLTDVQGNPWFTDFYYRGFVASPLQGTPQGFAVYQNGVRINEAFGDTVNLDLVPTVAIDKADIFTSNPIFGLNALGGALNLQTKNGFTWQGLETEFKAGSYGRFEGSAQWGKQVGNWAAYLAIEGARERGYRDFSASNTKKAFGDVGYKNENAEIHLNFTIADTHLGVVGPTPQELINRRGRSAVYTGAQTTDNKMGMLNLTGKFDLDNGWGLEANAYYRHFKQTHVDGNDTDIRPCNNSQYLCLQDDDDDDDGGDDDRRARARAAGRANAAAAPGEPDGPLVLDKNGNPILASILKGGTPGSLDRTFTKTNTVGTAVQFTNVSKVFGLDNHFVFGGSIDYSRVDFAGNSEICIIPNNLQCIGTGEIYHTAPGDDDDDVGIQPSELKTRTQTYGVFAVDTLDITDRLSVTGGARFNYQHVKLMDQLGDALNGEHHFQRVNPTIGATFKLTPNITAYANYAEANRAPTPLELGCADPTQPCLLEGFLVADPPLKQVVSRTAEAGLRGFYDPNFGGRFNWKAGVYRAQNSNDILNIPSAITGRGYFDNVGKTRRQGVELSAEYAAERWAIYANYSYVDATFRKGIKLGSPNSPFADGDGEINVRKGDHLPGIPEHQFKIGIDYMVTKKWLVGGDVVANSGVWLVGDESNQGKKLQSYATLNLHTSYQLTPQLKVFGIVNNVFNQKYATYGTYFDTGDIGFLNLTDPRSITRAQPISVYGGINMKFSADAAPVLATKD